MERFSKGREPKSVGDKTPATHPHHCGALPGRCVAALFVTFQASSDNNNGRRSDLLAQYHNILKQAVGLHHGDIMALSHKEALAVFTDHNGHQDPIQDAVETASSILNEVRQRNRLRLAQYLDPLRLGIGLDAGVLTRNGFDRHPCLDPGLQPCVNKARRLSALNCQAPFPTFFVSHVVASGLDNGHQYTVQNLGNVFVENDSPPLVVYAVMQPESAP